MIYEQGKPTDYFVLILEGRVEVIVGQEHLLFECGPFTYFGTQALVQSVGVGNLILNFSKIQLETYISINHIKTIETQLKLNHRNKSKDHYNH